MTRHKSPAGTTNPVVLVTTREVVERVKAKSFLVSTGIYLLIAMAAVVIPHLTEHHKTVYGIGLTGASAPALERALGDVAPALKVGVRTQRFASEADARTALQDKGVDVVVLDGARVVARGDIADTLDVLLNTAASQVKLAERLATAGLSPSEVATLLSPERLPVERTGPRLPIRASNRPLAFAGVIVIYLLLLTYGLTVANGVLEEKSSRVSEVLLGAVEPRQLLTGKVVGIGIVALVQLLAMGLPAAAVALVLGSFHVPSGTPWTGVAVVLWAVLGYGLYSCIFAATGAAASRPEDVGNATAPITILIAATYFAAIVAVQSPDSSVIRVLSFVPFMAPMTMLPRAAVGHVAWWEVPLSVALLLAMTYATVRLGARIYAGGIRRPGPRLKLREAWRAASV